MINLMKRNSVQSLFTSLLVGLAVMSQSVQAATAPSFAATIAAKGKSFEVTGSELEDAVIAYKASQAMAGSPIPKEAEPAIRTEVLNRLVATKIFLGKATDSDRESAKITTAKFIEESKKRSPSEASFKRQILASGKTMEVFEAEVNEQSVVKAVIDRMLKSKQNVTDEEVRKYYEANPKEFTDPTRYKVRHVFLTLRDPESRQSLSDLAKQTKVLKMNEIASRARKGEDFAALAREYSEDRVSKELGGEYNFTMGQGVPEFESATANLKPGQISDVVISRMGVHLIQLVEATPGKLKSFDEVQQRIKDGLLQEKSQKALPEFIAQMRKEQEVQVLDAGVK